MLLAELGDLTNKSPLTKRKAFKILADRHGMAVNELYRLLDDADERRSYDLIYEYAIGS